MAAIDNLVNVTITQATTAVATESFAVPLILGTSASWTSDHVRVYSGPGDLLTDGFTSSAPEYLAAVAMYSGDTTPSSFMVGRRTSGAVADDLASIFGQNNNAYGIVGAGLPQSDILPIAQYVEGNKKLYLASVGDDAVPTSASDDIASQLKAEAFQRTGLIYTKANTNGVLEAAWMGSQLPQTPGSNNWAYKALPGASVDTLTGNQQAVLYGVPNAGIQGKNVNVYQYIAGANITFPGQAVGGRFFDITVGLDWLQANIQSAVFAQLANMAKVPYTDAGVASIMSPIDNVLRVAELNGLLDGNDAVYPVRVWANPVSSMSQADRAARRSPTVQFQGRLQGAFNSVAVAGTVQV